MVDPTQYQDGSEWDSVFGKHANVDDYCVAKIYIDSDSKKSLTEWKQEILNKHLKQDLQSYLWCRDQFFLEEKAQINALEPACLEARIRTGDEPRDEWFLFYLMKNRVTKNIGECSVVLEDQDGSFLAIEAALTLPKWVNPETAVNRIFLRDGCVHLLDPVKCSAAGAGHGGDHNKAGGAPASSSLSKQATSCTKNPLLAELSLPTALHYLQKHADSGRTIAKANVQRQLQQKIESFPKKALEHCTHWFQCVLPKNVALLLEKYPAVISDAMMHVPPPPAVDLKKGMKEIKDHISSTAEQHQYCKFITSAGPNFFTDAETAILHPVRFTRLHFAKLQHYLLEIKLPREFLALEYYKFHETTTTNLDSSKTPARASLSNRDREAAAKMGALVSFALQCCFFLNGETLSFGSGWLRFRDGFKKFVEENEIDHLSVNTAASANVNEHEMKNKASNNQAPSTNIPCSPVSVSQNNNSKTPVENSPLDWLTVDPTELDADLQQRLDEFQKFDNMDEKEAEKLGGKLQDILGKISGVDGIDPENFFSESDDEAETDDEDVASSGVESASDEEMNKSDKNIKGTSASSAEQAATSKASPATTTASKVSGGPVESSKEQEKNSDNSAAAAASSAYPSVSLAAQLKDRQAFSYTTYRKLRTSCLKNDKATDAEKKKFRTLSRRSDDDETDSDSDEEQTKRQEEKEENADITTTSKNGDKQTCSGQEQAAGTSTTATTFTGGTPLVAQYERDTARGSETNINLTSEHDKEKEHALWDTQEWQNDVKKSVRIKNYVLKPNAGLKERDFAKKKWQEDYDKIHAQPPKEGEEVVGEMKSEQPESGTDLLQKATGVSASCESEAKVGSSADKEDNASTTEAASVAGCAGDEKKEGISTKTDTTNTAEHQRDEEINTERQAETCDKGSGIDLARDAISRREWLAEQRREKELIVMLEKELKEGQWTKKSDEAIDVAKFLQELGMDDEDEQEDDVLAADTEAEEHLPKKAQLSKPTSSKVKATLLPTISENDVEEDGAAESKTASAKTAASATTPSNSSTACSTNNLMSSTTSISASPATRTTSFMTPTAVAPKKLSPTSSDKEGHDAELLRRHNEDLRAELFGGGGGSGMRSKKQKLYENLRIDDIDEDMMTKACMETDEDLHGDKNNLSDDEDEIDLVESDKKFFQKLRENASPFAYDNDLPGHKKQIIINDIASEAKKSQAEKQATLVKKHQAGGGETKIPSEPTAIPKAAIQQVAEAAGAKSGVVAGSGGRSSGSCQKTTLAAGARLSKPAKRVLKQQEGKDEDADDASSDSSAESHMNFDEEMENELMKEFPELGLGDRTVDLKDALQEHGGAAGLLLREFQGK
ncbi:unnamed protein product [Amoebophrya sp. A120]|nr:unnamed protein product [Amoebophrya sp. A120]|eukprot:GSA120T00018637001.1